MVFDVVDCADARDSNVAGGAGAAQPPGEVRAASFSGEWVGWPWPVGIVLMGVKADPSVDQSCRMVEGRCSQFRRRWLLTMV